MSLFKRYREVLDESKVKKKIDALYKEIEETNNLVEMAIENKDNEGLQKILPNLHELCSKIKKLND